MTPTTTGASTPQDAAAVPAWLRATLRCPVTGEELTDAQGPAGEPLLVSRGAGLAYPVRDGVPVLLAHEATRA